MPVVSQSITRPIVPVGAMTETWALRKPCCSPSASAWSQAVFAAVDEGGVGAVGRIERDRRDGERLRSRRVSPWAARRWLRMTRSMASRLAAKPGKAPIRPAISAEVA